MDARTKRWLGDAFIVSSWGMYVAAFLVIWAPFLPAEIAAGAMLGAVVGGHLIGITWKRHVVGRVPLAATWLGMTGD